MIEYVNGDLFKNLNVGKNILIPHCVNDIGAWGAGFVIPLAKAFPISREEYLKASNNNEIYLGKVQYVDCTPKNSKTNKIIVANMCAQHNTISVGNKKPVKYAALTKCMEDIALKMEESIRFYKVFEIYCPKFCSGLAGGNWDFIEELIDEIWGDIKVTVFCI